MNRYERINNKKYIYNNIKLFYEYSSEKIFKSVLENFTRNILNDILFNISLDDLNKLVACRENWEHLKIDDYTSFRFINITKETNKDFSKIIHENTQKFLNSNSLCDVIEDIIY